MIPCGGSRPAFPPRVARLVWTPLRRGGARPLALWLRRSPRPALPPLARRHARAGAVGVEPGLVGGLSRAAVLSAGLRVRGRAPPPRVLRRAVGLGCLSGARLDGVPRAGADGLPGARARVGQRLAGAAARVRRADAVRRDDERRRGWRAHRDDRRAARVGARPPAAPGPPPL